MKYDWEVVLSVKDPSTAFYPKAQQARCLSINAIASVLQRDPFIILDEMEESKRVGGFFCGDVRAWVFLLTNTDHAWQRLVLPRAFTEARLKLKKEPCKGYSRKGLPIINTPFEDADKEYEALIYKALEEFRNALKEG